MVQCRRNYKNIGKKMREDLHGGKVIESIPLARFLGQERLYLFTADYRMYKVLEKARKITLRQAESWASLKWQRV